MRERTGKAREGGLERLFSRQSPLLPLILKAQLAFLAVLAVVSFILPLSGPQRLVVFATAGLLAGLTWAILDHVRQG